MITPRNGMVLKGPVQLARGEIDCWNCHKPTPVVSIVAAELIEYEDGQPYSDRDGPCFVRDIGEDEMPTGLAAALAKLAPRYRPRYSRTMGETTWANGCEHCDALQGAFYLHMEPDGPFFGGADEFEGELIELSSLDVVIHTL